METTRSDAQVKLPWLTKASFGQLATHAVLTFASLLAIVPFVWMFFSSFKTFKDLVSNPGMMPTVWTTKNYIEIASKVNFPAAFLNSAIASTTVTAATLLTSGRG